MADPSIEIVRHVEELMRQKLGSIQQQQVAPSGGVDALADILNHVDRSTESNVLESLDQTDEEVAVELRQLLFTFEDIIKLDDRAMQLVIREADPKDLAMALRAAGDEVKQQILANMSLRGAQMLIEDIEHQPPQRKRVIRGSPRPGGRNRPAPGGRRNDPHRPRRRGVRRLGEGRQAPAATAA